jgi:hypothetical protein
VARGIDAVPRQIAVVEEFQNGFDPGNHVLMVSVVEVASGKRPFAHDFVFAPRVRVELDDDAHRASSFPSPVSC